MATRCEVAYLIVAEHPVTWPTFRYLSRDLDTEYNTTCNAPISRRLQPSFNTSPDCFQPRNTSRRPWSASDLVTDTLRTPPFPAASSMSSNHSSTESHMTLRVLDLPRCLYCYFSSHRTLAKRCGMRLTPQTRHSH